MDLFIPVSVEYARECMANEYSELRQDALAKTLLKPICPDIALPASSMVDCVAPLSALHLMAVIHCKLSQYAYFWISWN